MTPNIRTPEGRVVMQKACDEATPGPWCFDCRGEGYPWHVKTAYGYDAGSWKPDAAFIALARTALPDALAYIASLESRLQAADGIAKAAREWLALEDGDFAEFHDADMNLRAAVNAYDAVKR